MSESSKKHIFILAYNRYIADKFIRRHNDLFIGKYINRIEDILGYDPKSVDVYRLSGWEIHPYSYAIMNELTCRNFKIRDWKEIENGE